MCDEAHTWRKRNIRFHNFCPQERLERRLLQTGTLRCAGHALPDRPRICSFHGATVSGEFSGARLEGRRSFEHPRVSCVVIWVIPLQFSRDHCVSRDRAVIRIIASIVYDGVSRYFMPPAKQFHGTRFDDLQRGILREFPQRRELSGAGTAGAPRRFQNA